MVELASSLTWLLTGMLEQVCCSCMLEQSVHRRCIKSGLARSNIPVRQQPLTVRHT